MKKYILCGKLVLCLFAVLIYTISVVSAGKKTFHGTGEYTMSDYETPAVAEQRALSYAKQRAAEQAGAYVETYTHMEKVQVAEDRVSVLTIGAMEIISQNTEKKALSNGDVRIVANIIAEVDTSYIDKALSNESRNNQDNGAILLKLKQAIIKEEQETQELKRKIVELKERKLPVNDLQIKAKEKEKIFLAQQKFAQSYEWWCEGKYDKALEVANEAVLINPKDEFGYLIRGLTFTSKREYDKAIKNCNIALSINNRNQDVYVCRGNIYLYNKDYDKAMQDYNRALSIDEKHLLACNNRGVIYEYKGDYEKAIDDYNKALNIDNKYSLSYCNRGNVYAKMGMYDRALKDYDTALKYNPKIAEPHVNRGNVYADKGEYDKAINEYNRALRINPNNAGAYNNRGFTYGQKGEYDKAIEDFNKVLSINPNNAGAYYYRGVAYGEKGEYDKAIEDFNKVLSINPNDDRVKKNLQIVYELKRKSNY